MNAASYVHILETTLLPAVDVLFRGDNYRFMQDNDPKHTSKCAREFFAKSGINWWKNLWQELKEYICREAKPTTKRELIDGILQFWRTVDVNKCRKYIGHLNKVIPKVIEVQGAASGY